MQQEVDNLRQKILTALPNGSIIPCHDSEGHHYQLAFAPGSPIVDSVTTKGGILDKSKYLQPWAVKLALEHVRENWQRAKTSTAERELVFMDAEAMHKTTLKDAGDVGTDIHATIERYLNDWIATKRRPSSIVHYAPNTGDVRITSAIRAAEKFCIENGVIPVYSELLVGSNKHKVAGTLDFLAYVQKEVIPQSPNPDDSTDVFVREMFRSEEIERRAKLCPAEADHQYWATGRGGKHECMKCGKRVRYELTLVDWKSSNSIDKPEYMMQTSTYSECLKENTGIKVDNITIVQLSKTNGEYAVLHVDKKKRIKAFDAFKNLTKTYDWLHSEHADFEAKTRKVMKI